MKERLEELKHIHGIQSMDGNYDFNPHMYSVYMGLEIALAIMEGRAPDYKPYPEKWIEDRLEEGYDETIH